MLGPEETCTGDPARRAGNEFLFQMLAAQNVEVLNAVFEGRAPGTRKIVITCPHCFNTLGHEYPQLDGHYEVVHHTQLLNRLVREGRLVPVATPDGELADVTYHDPCYLGRHNEVYAEPRELVGASGVRLTEMPRHADRSFCCGAGGARMWMEEKIGKRINLDRVDEALGTGAEKIATGCPFCRVMLSDGLTQRQSEERGTEVEVLDVAQLLLAAVTRGAPAPARTTPVDALGAGAPGVETTPLSGTQVNGSGPASAVSRGPGAGDVSATHRAERPARARIGAECGAGARGVVGCARGRRRGVEPSSAARDRPGLRPAAGARGAAGARLPGLDGARPALAHGRAGRRRRRRRRARRPQRRVDGEPGARSAATATSPRWSPSGSGGRAAAGLDAGEHGPPAQRRPHPRAGPARGAREYPVARTPKGGAAIRERFTGRLAGRVADLPPIALVGDSWTWASSGSPDDAAVVLRAPDFDLARALVTRRSAAQLQSWTVRGDVTPYLDAFAMLGPLPSTDLTES